MTVKLSISLTDEQMRLVNAAVDSGDYASTSEVIRDALRDWRAKHLLGQLWDEGVASGPADPQLSAEEIKREARRRTGR